MKKTLLSIALCALVGFVANADESVITFLGGNYDGSAPKINITTETFEMDKAYDIPGVGTFTVTRPEDVTNTSQVKAADNPHLQFAKKNIIVISPVDVTITKVVLHCTTQGYTANVTPSQGTAEVDKEAKLVTWTGSASTPLSLTHNVDTTNPIRIMYIEITYADDGNSGIEGVSVDDAESLYYNLNGTRVTNPVKGNVYVKVKGNEAGKVIAQ